jgi:hypothetical protein
MAAKQVDRKRQLRSKAWFDNPLNPGMTALYLERYLNYGLTPGELRSGKPSSASPRREAICRPVTGTISSWPNACATASPLRAV